ncbi:MAG TPA: lytic transglycosylase domain-containing protein [Thermoanaerobaculia bacterium]|nr:lytic transglycosylase domain-containing protein [Thermoanaerobaculia bacterium]
MKKRRAVAAVAAAVLLIVVAAAIVISRQRVRRRPYFSAVRGEQPSSAPLKLGPIEEWTQQFRALEVEGRWDDLLQLLDQAQRIEPRLAYLRARAYVEADDKAAAMRALAPFVANGPFRDLALFHRADLEEGAAASRDRQALIFGFPSSTYRDDAIDDETESLASRNDPNAFAAFASKLYASASTELRRDLDAHLVEIFVRRGDMGNALAKGMVLLRGGTMDDPADRVSRALDRPELIRRMTADQLAILGDAMQNHRHFDRAVALLSTAIRALPKKHDELQFAIGRSEFGAEKFAQAQQIYLSGANGTRDPKWKCTFLWHAARAAQLQNNDALAERLMSAAAAVPGRFPSANAAITQRLRTRVKQRRFAEAQNDLALLRKDWPRDHAVVDASVAYAIGAFGAGNPGAAVVTLNSIPRKLLDKFDSAEVDYWRARALENINPQASFAAYLGVLRSTVPTHFAYFARQRLDSDAMAPKLARELAVRDAQIPRLIAAKQFDLARRVQTDRILLSSSNSAAELQRLSGIYRQIPAFRNILELKPEAFPHFPLPANADRATLLMAMGLFDEASDDAMSRWPLRPPRDALTRSLALNMGNASKDSIYAIEVLMKSVPDDYVPELLPLVVRRLLYPRYFDTYIAEDSKHFGADPMLVLSIMREESRFNPRAKSVAAARGLLQFIITTARDIGRDIGLVGIDPDDLYDPRVVIRLGAKYVSTLSKQFANDDYEIAAAYNAGPHQTALWKRLAPGDGDDFFLSSVSFDETKDYVRKVMNSYKRYVEIYGNAGPQGGIRVEP